MSEEIERDEFADDEGEQSFSEEQPLGREVITTPYDAPVRTLMDEIKEKTLIVNPPFQRGTVWTKKLKSRLIESLLLNIPVPVLYFAEDEDGTKVVVDGQQRLRAIDEFHSGQLRLGDLQVLPSLNGSRWTDLTKKQARTILSRTLRCVVVSARSSMTLRFEMFERLNTGNVPLNDQELRNCIYRGSFNELLDEIVNDERWLRVVRRPAPDHRLRHHELVLRFFALHDSLLNYRPPLKAVLNTYMEKNRRAEEPERNALRELIFHALENVFSVFGDRAFRRVRTDKEGAHDWDRSLNRAVFDTQMLSLTELDAELIEAHKDAIFATFRDLCLSNAEFADSLSRATADRSRFYTRLRIWGDALAQKGVEPGYMSKIPPE